MSEKSVYIVNPYGTVHSVSESIANERLKDPDWHLATEEEIKRLQELHGNQTMKNRVSPSLRGRPGTDAKDAFK